MRPEKKNQEIFSFNMKYKLPIVAVFAMLIGIAPVYSQNKPITKEQVLAMSAEQLSELSLEELMQAVELLGVKNIDELFAIIMNKNVSSASKKEEIAFTSPLATTVITQEEMLSYGCKTIEEAFRLIPGMIVLQKANGVFDVQMRGLNNIPDGNLLLYTENANVLLMVDGRVMHNYSIGTMTMENLPVSIIDVDRIEVVRGACSALYGVNALNGVINIITRRPSDSEHKVNANISAGSHSTYTAELAFRKRATNTVAWGVTGNLQYRQRPTDKLYAVSGGDTYIVNDASLMQQTYTTSDINNLIANGSLTEVQSNNMFSVEQYGQMVQLATSAKLDGTQELFYSTPFEYRDATQCFSDSKLARRNWGVNAYADINPSADLAICLTAGYSQSLAMQTTIMEAPYSFAFRQFKKGYFNADVRYKDLHVQANYYAGPENYAVGRPGLKANFKQIFASADYDIFLGDFNIRPGFYYQYMYGKDYKPTFDYGDGKGEQTLSGFFNDDATLSSIAPSIRLDYSLDKWRFIVAARGDKTSIPDKWNLSLQGVVTHQFNDNNFIRLNYGHGVRSANMLNANSNYKWQRTGMTYPNTIEFFGNEDANLVSIDNFELGYRWQPTMSLLIDAEVFYSRSKDYGAMMSFDSQAFTSYENMYSAMKEILTTADGNAINVNKALSSLMSKITSRSNSSYDNLPYKVNQMGFSLNADWIISSKVVAKLNANVQQTIIDNYYLYNQAASLNEQFYGDNGIVSNLAEGLRDIVFCMEGLSADGNTQLSTNEKKLGTNVITALASLSHSEDYVERVNAMSDAQREALFDALRTAYFDKSYILDSEGKYGQRNTTYQNTLTLYYALKYGIDYNQNAQEYTFSQSHIKSPKQVNGHKHKSTPSVYGMIGVIVKPVSQLNIAAYANFVGKRTYTTVYGTQELDNRMTLNAKIGYTIFDGLEVSVTGDNIFNTEKQEFIYSDKIGGIYSVGLKYNL